MKDSLLKKLKLILISSLLNCHKPINLVRFSTIDMTKYKGIDMTKYKSIEMAKFNTIRMVKFNIIKLGKFNIIKLLKINRQKRTHGKLCHFDFIYTLLTSFMN